LGGFISKSASFLLLIMCFSVLSFAGEKLSKSELQQQLYSATLYDNVKEVKRLMDLGADPLYNPGSESYALPPAFAAFENESLQVAAYYLDHGVDPFSSYKSKTLLHYAIQKDMKGDFISRLIKMGLDVNKYEGVSYVSVAARYGNLKALELLIQERADFSIRDKGIKGPNSFTPLRYLIEGLFELDEDNYFLSRPWVKVLDLLLSQKIIITEMGMRELRRLKDIADASINGGDKEEIYNIWTYAYKKVARTAYASKAKCKVDEEISEKFKRFTKLKFQVSRTGNEIEERDKLQAEVEEAGCVAILPGFDQINK
jgi:hypothetical protein